MAQFNRGGFEQNRTYNYVTRSPEAFDAGRHIGEEPRGFLGSAWDNVWGGMETMVGGAMDTAGTMLKAQYEDGRASRLAGLAGKYLVDGSIDLNQSAAENARRSGVRNEYSDMGIFDRLTSPSYLLDPRGFTAEVSNMTGSMIPFMLMSAVMPEVGAGTAAGSVRSTWTACAYAACSNACTPAGNTGGTSSSSARCAGGRGRAGAGG